MADSLESVLARIPGYAGYKAAEQNTQNREIGDLHKSHTLQSLLAQIQMQELNKQFAGAMGSGSLVGGGGTPEQLDTLAAKLASAGHPGSAALSGLADKRRKAIADAATLKTIQSGPAQTIQPDPQEAQQTADQGTPAVGPATVPGKGGLFATLAQSEIPGIANQAKLYQQQANVSDPRSVSPTHWVDLQKTLAAQEMGLLERRTAAQTRVDNRPPPKTPAPAASSAPALSEDALNDAAARYKLDGTFPPNLGRGAQKDVTIATILNRAAALAKEEGNSGEAARIAQISGRAATQALGQLVKQKNMVLAFEKNAVLNADIALQESEKVDRLGSPVVDRWIQAGKKNLAGDASVAKLDAAIRTFVNEYARVTTSVTGGGVTSDTARKEIDELLRGAHTKEQVRDVIGLMKREMENRRIGYEQQEAELKRGISGAPPPEAPAAPAPSAAAPATTGGPKTGEKAKSRSGKPMTWDGKQWVYD